MSLTTTASLDTNTVYEIFEVLKAAYGKTAN